ncbi:MAG: hypothetical protein R3C61_16115 [Bacteroidia bacterium]
MKDKNQKIFEIVEEIRNISFDTGGILAYLNPGKNIKLKSNIDRLKTLLSFYENVELINKVNDIDTTFVIQNHLEGEKIIGMILPFLDEIEEFILVQEKNQSKGVDLEKSTGYQRNNRNNLLSSNDPQQSVMINHDSLQKNLKSDLLTYFANNDHDNFFALLSKHLKDSTEIKSKKELILLLSQYNRLKDEGRLNVISKDDYNLSMNKISESLIDFIERYL